MRLSWRAYEPHGGAPVLGVRLDSAAGLAFLSKLRDSRPGSQYS